MIIQQFDATIVLNRVLKEVFEKEETRFYIEQQKVAKANSTLVNDQYYYFKFRSHWYPITTSNVNEKPDPKCPLHISLHQEMAALLADRRKFEMETRLVFYNFLVSALNVTLHKDLMIQLFPEKLQERVYSILDRYLPGFMSIDPETQTKFDKFCVTNEKYITLLKVRFMDDLLTAGFD